MDLEGWTMMNISPCRAAERIWSMEDHGSIDHWISLNPKWYFPFFWDLISLTPKKPQKTLKWALKWAESLRHRLWQWSRRVFRRLSTRSQDQGLRPNHGGAAKIGGDQIARPACHKLNAEAAEFLWFSPNFYGKIAFNICMMGNPVF